MKNKDWLPKSVNYLTQTAALMGLEVQGFNLHNNVHLTHKTGGLNENNDLFEKQLQAMHLNQTMAQHTQH